MCVKNFDMRGRVFGIKKTTILTASFFVNLSLCLFLILFSIFFWQNYFLWFFIFCFFAGLHAIIKSMLFRLDSACYLGFLLCFLGVAGFTVYFLDLPFKYFYFMMAAALASFVSFLFTKQKFHIFLGILLFASGLLSFLYCINVLNLAVFLSIYLLFLFIFVLVCVILYLRYIRK